MYEGENFQDFLRFEDASDLSMNDKKKRMQEKILWADEIVFVFPIWWGNMPAVLKNFFDVNFSSGFAFKYEKKLPKGLLK